MQTYFLHVEYANGETFPDLEGAQFANASDAKAEAVSSMRELIASAVLHGSEPPRCIIVEEKGSNAATGVITGSDAVPKSVISAYFARSPSY